MKTGTELITAERERQMAEEGWTSGHDDTYIRGELIDGALSYVHSAINIGHPVRKIPPSMWPWADEWWKPSSDSVRNLVKAGALIAAEVDRLNRQSANKGGNNNMSSGD